MNTPQLTTSLAVDIIWHTNWGFAVKQIIGGRSYNYFLDHRIAGLHREYAEKFIIPWKRREHADTKNREGTSSPLLPATTAFLRARIVSTLDDIPLNPTEAQEVVRRIWWARIAAVREKEKQVLIEQQEKICSALQTVIDGKVSTILALDGIVGVCCGLEQLEAL